MFDSSGGWSSLEFPQVLMVNHLELPTVDEFRADLQNMVWGDVVTFATLAMSVSVTAWMLGRLGG